MHQALRCPESLDPLELRQEAIYCAACDKSWPVVDGIPVLLSNPTVYWGELERTEMQDMVQTIKENGLQSFFLDSLSRRNLYLYNYAANPTRADFQYLLPIDKASVVLDCGSGWGIISRVLAKRVNWVYALDITLERAQFLKHAVEAENLPNVTPICGGDFDHLPFDDASVDAAILNGVLEWVGDTVRTDPPRRVQVNALMNLHRVLKKGGALYIGIENRFGYNYFLGDPDHNGLRFTSLLPRRCADLVEWHCRRRTYRTYTYGFWGYRKLLREAGFSDVTIYWSYPNYRELQAIVPLRNRQEASFFLRQYGPKETIRKRLLYQAAGLLAQVGLLKYIVPSYSIIARK